MKMERRQILQTLMAGAVAVMATPAFASGQTDGSVAVIKAEVEAIIARFMIRAAGVASAFTAPAVDIRFTPQLSWISEDTKTITSAAWSQCPPDFQGFIASLVEGADMTPELFFGETFNAFLVPHEMAHFIDVKLGTFGERADLYDGEVHANCVAVAFWMGEVGGVERLTRLMTTVQVVLNHLPNPAPEGQDVKAYFNANYEQLGANPAAYGWYQFRMFLDAWALRDQVDLVSLLRRAPA